jgi:solute carrier family 10 (sodium/bile acid cotransporter), member 3/5
MMPLWLYTLGRTLANEAQISLPYLRLFLNLLVTIGPCLIGLLLNIKFPQLKKFMLKFVKKLVICLIICFLIITLIAKYYVFQLITWKQWLAGPLIPWCGFLFGGLLAWISQRPTKVVKIKKYYTVLMYDRFNYI